MKVLAALSGGVDSAVAAARMVDAGHDVTGVTLKLWGGDTDSGCCSVRDVEDARRVARLLQGLRHGSLTVQWPDGTTSALMFDAILNRMPPPPSRINPDVPPELESIIRKALEKDRTRRYDTAHGLAMDIQRHLANEPVLARPPSAAYKMQKAWQRKNC